MSKIEIHIPNTGRCCTCVFTSKQVHILVFAIITGIAFIETSGPLQSVAFWREFMMNLFIYGLVAEFAVIALLTFTNYFNSH